MNYTFNENQLIGIVKNTINEIEEERSYNVFSKLIKDIDMSRGVHFRNMKKMTEKDKIRYLYAKICGNYASDKMCNEEKSFFLSKEQVLTLCILSLPFILLSQKQLLQLSRFLRVHFSSQN